MMYLITELARDQHRRDLEQVSRTRHAMRVRAIGRATRRAQRAERRMLAARRAAARLGMEPES
jgi:hypothetical protein